MKTLSVNEQLQKLMTPDMKTCMECGYATDDPEKMAFHLTNHALQEQVDKLRDALNRRDIPASKAVINVLEDLL